MWNMENREHLLFVLNELRMDNMQKQKKGLHFIAASVLLWFAIYVIHSTTMPILTKNLYTFFCSAPLFPLAFLISKIIRVDFQNRKNPITTLGILMAVNQILYILIAMWVYAAEPDKMVMVYAIIFGAHLLPYGWLYKSYSYYVFSVLIPVIVLVLGINCPSATVAFVMFVMEIIFCVCLKIEVQHLNK